MATMYKTIESLCEKNGITIGKLCGEIGVSRSVIGELKSGRTKKLSAGTMGKIADYFDVSVDRILTGEDKTPANIIPVPEMKKVPLLGTIACGEPILADENIDGFLSMPEGVAADFCLRCKGDSMINARIFDGDIVYIRSQPNVNDGEIAAVLIGDEATLKRVHLFQDHIVLEPENPQYRPIVYWAEEMENVRIIGKAVAFTSAVR